MEVLRSHADPDSSFYWSVLRANWWLVMLLVVASTATTGLMVIRQPPVYEARVDIVALSPPWEDPSGALIAPVIANLGSPFRVLKVDFFESISWELYSRTLLDAVIEELDLQRYYGVETMDQTRMILDGRRSIQLVQDGHLQVTVQDSDPAMAAAIANAHARQLALLDRRMLVEAAAVRRRVLEARLREAEVKLMKAEQAWIPLGIRVAVARGGGEAMAGDLAPSGQGSGSDQDQEDDGSAFSRIALVKHRALRFEVDQALIRSFATPAHPQNTSIEAQLAAIRQAVDRLERGGSGGDEGSFIPPLAQLPELALPSQRLAREVKAQGQYYLQWRQALEDVLVEELVDQSRIWVLDPAVAVEHPRHLW